MPTRINRPQTMLTEEESAGMEIRVAKMRRPQLKTSTWISGASPSNFNSVNLRDFSKKASLRGCTQSRSMLKYWTYRRWEGVVKSSTFPPRRSQQRWRASEQFSIHPIHASKQAQTVSVRPFPVYDMNTWIIGWKVSEWESYQTVNGYNVLIMVNQPCFHRDTHLHDHS